MNNEERLKKINKELKSYVNEAAFISLKLRNKIIKMLGEEFEIKLPIENFKNIDVKVTEAGNIIMRDEEYKRVEELTIEEIEEKYNTFSAKAKDILKRKEINYYTMNDNSNIVNVFILVFYVLVSLALFAKAIEEFLVGEYQMLVWVIFIVMMFFIPNFRERLEQAINFIKRKFKK